MINLQLPIAGVHKTAPIHTHTQPQPQQRHANNTNRQITIDTRNLENVHIIHNIFVWYLNKLFMANTMRVLWLVWYEFNAAGTERLRFSLSLSLARSPFLSTSISHILNHWLNSNCCKSHLTRVLFQLNLFLCNLFSTASNSKLSLCQRFYLYSESHAYKISMCFASQIRCSWKTKPNRKQK